MFEIYFKYAWDIYIRVCKHTGFCPCVFAYMQLCQEWFMKTGLTLIPASKSFIITKVTINCPILVVLWLNVRTYIAGQAQLLKIMSDILQTILVILLVNCVSKGLGLMSSLIRRVCKWLYHHGPLTLTWLKAIFNEAWDRLKRVIILKDTTYLLIISMIKIGVSKMGHIGLSWWRILKLPFYKWYLTRLCFIVRLICREFIKV